MAGRIGMVACAPFRLVQPMPSRHRFLEPIHNVKEGRERPGSTAEAAKCVSSSLENLLLFSAKARRRVVGGAYRDRTDDLMLAKQPLSQLS